jgi:hypothetical protein
MAHTLKTAFGGRRGAGVPGRSGKLGRGVRGPPRVLMIFDEKRVSRRGHINPGVTRDNHRHKIRGIGQVTQV